LIPGGLRDIFARLEQQKEPDNMIDLSDQSALVQKTRELCEALVEQADFESNLEKTEAFWQDVNARKQLSDVRQLQEELQRRQHSGEELPEEDIEQFKLQHQELLENPVARGYLEAQSEMKQLQQTVQQWITKTFEVGRVPLPSDFLSCGGSCQGCSCN
jgi:cell fate (sporulation/competence/biofilm development) regulator YlbF (YheA/YmcA/DUF963 family)